MGPMSCASPHLGPADLITSWRGAEVAVQTFLILIKVGRKNELMLFKSGKDTEK